MQGLTEGQEHLQEKIRYNPTSGYRKKVANYIRELKDKDVIDDKLMYRLLPDSESTVPAFYGLPKIHKPEPIPMCPIVSSIGSVTYKVAKYEAQILSPLVGKTEHHVKNSKDFVNKIISLTKPEDESVVCSPVFHLLML